jgi:hypothetical protein
MDSSAYHVDGFRLGFKATLGKLAIKLDGDPVLSLFISVTRVHSRRSKGVPRAFRGSFQGSFLDTERSLERSLNRFLERSTAFLTFQRPFQRAFRVQERTLKRPSERPWNALGTPTVNTPNV